MWKSMRWIQLSIYIKKSSDGKYVWITKVEVSDKHTSNQLKFPEKINESIFGLRWI